MHVHPWLFFAANDAVHGDELWKSDGTAVGTVLVKDLDPLGGGNSNLRYLTSVNGTMFFQADDGVSGAELWKSDGTAAGTAMVKDIDPNYLVGSPEGSAGLVPDVGKAFFYLAQYRNGRLASGWGTESGSWPAEPTSCDVGCPGQAIGTTVASGDLLRK